MVDEVLCTVPGSGIQLWLKKQEVPGLMELHLLWGHTGNQQAQYTDHYVRGDKSREKKRKGYRGRGRKEIKQHFWKASRRRWHLRKGWRRWGSQPGGDTWGNSIRSRRNSMGKGSGSAQGFRTHCKAFTLNWTGRHWVGWAARKTN